MKIHKSPAYNIYKKLTEDGESTISEALKKQIQKLSDKEKSQLFWLVKDLDFINHELFKRELKIWRSLDHLFKANYDKTAILIREQQYTLTLIKAGIIVEVLDFEDFRSIVRYIYTNSTNPDSTIEKIYSELVEFLFLIKSPSEGLIKKCLSLIRFLGLPPAGSDHLIEEINKFFPSSIRKIEYVQQLPVATCQKYPEYVREIAEKLNYDKDIPLMKDWLDHTILNKLTEEKLAQFIKSWDPNGFKANKVFFQQLQEKRVEENITSIPLNYKTFIKPYSKKLTPQTVRTTELPQTILPKLLPSYLERLAYQLPKGNDSELKVTFLGGAQIGTMGILVTTPKSNILIDYGLSVANYQIPAWHEALPHIDVILLTHAHLDHSGAIPYLFSQGYSGLVLGSSMTKELTKYLLIDSQRLVKNNFSEAAINQDYRFNSLVQESYLHQMMDNFITIKSGNEYQITPDVVVRPFKAHHIQGSLAFQIESHGKRILYTGDINFDPSTLFQDKPAKIPLDSDLTIIDGTYYGQQDFNVTKRDKLLFKTVKESRRVIIPAFTIGRAQEIMLKLEKVGLTQDRKISLLGLASKVARLSGIKTKTHLSNQLVQPFEDEIVIAGGGMLNGGFARSLVEETKSDPNTSIILCGYLAKNTLGYRLLHGLEPDYEQKVVFTRFSGHSSNKTLKKTLSSIKGVKAIIHIGDLTKDPLTVEKEQKINQYKEGQIKIPSLGSTMVL